MINYGDITFCVSKNCTNKCGKKLTPEIREKARKWWGGDGAPICVDTLCDDNAPMPKGDIIYSFQS